MRSRGVEVLSPDRFLRRRLDGSAAAVVDFTRQAQANLIRTAPTREAYKALLLRIGLADFVCGIEEYEARLDAQGCPEADEAAERG